MSESVRTDGDAVSPHTRRRRSSPVVATLLVVGFAIVFGAAGYLVSVLRAPTYSVSAKVQAQPTPTLDNSNPAPSTIDENDIFMQSQVETMSSVTGQLPGDASVTVSQVGLSSVLQVTATATTRSVAVDAANQVVQRYIALRDRQVRDYTANALAQIGSQLDQDTSALKALDPNSPQASAERNALNSDYGRLLTLKRQVSLSAATSSATQVIGHAALGNVVQVSNDVRNAVLAAVVGALIGVGVTVASRSRSGRGHTDARPRSLAELARS